MAMLTVGHENSAPIRLYYEDLGGGSPVVLVHGFPLSSQAWERQVTILLEEGHRVITYDRRGSCRSSRPTTGYNWETFADDLNTLLTALDIRQGVLVGHSIGTGDVMRYLRLYGSKRVCRAALIAPIDPSIKPADGLSPRTRIERLTTSDRYAGFSQAVADYYNIDEYLGSRVSPEVIKRTWDMWAAASPMLPDQVALALGTDFHVDAETIDVPVLVVIAGADRIFPASASYRFDAFARSKRVLISCAPHGLLWTHADEVNRELLEFIDA